MSILIAMNFACTFFGLTPEEALAGTTSHAATALGLSGRYGVLAPGAAAELAVWNCRHPSELVYEIGGAPFQRSLVQRGATWS